MGRFLRKQLRKLTWWQQLLGLALAPMLALNLAVAFFGQSLVSPLSPFYLHEKWQALKLYARHRPGCLLHGHQDLEQIAAEAERREGLPPGLMRAVVAVESDTCAHRISPAGAMGPAQLMPSTALMLGVKDPFDPRESIDAGARYLSQQLRRTGRVDLAVASYNAGPGAVNGSVPHNGETAQYVDKVLRRLASHRG